MAKRPALHEDGFDKPARDVGKSAGKSAVTMRPGPRGGMLRVGSLPGNTPGSGRPPDEFKAAMRALATYAEQAGYVRDVLMDKDHPQWLGALKFVTEHGYGKPTQPMEHTGKDGGPIQLTVAYEDDEA